MSVIVVVSEGAGEGDGEGEVRNVCDVEKRVQLCNGGCAWVVGQMAQKCFSRCFRCTELAGGMLIARDLKRCCGNRMTSVERSKQLFFR